ncbi:MAG TPA: adenylate/guanylate cyclase domain-containing protein [Chitinophagaceae bacterium]|jgi:adenylate cyclase|nr:adenylate/guanylate cyclase domain-containing protein [Chitinophagaceae bacterium]
MRPPHIVLPKRSAVKKRELKLILSIALSWTIIDLLIFGFRIATDNYTPKYESTNAGSLKAIFLRELNVFVFSLIIGYFLISVFRNFKRNLSPGANLLLKTVLLVALAIAMNFFIYFTYSLVIQGQPASVAFHKFVENTFREKWLLEKMPEWVLLFILTQLALEINQKYSQGVFFNIIIGKYLQPREEDRIIMFIDLKNSTPIAEKLGHKEYFKFIRDVIFCLSAGIAEYDGRIYQYVGDEVVAWWPSSKINARKAVNAIISGRKIINKNAEVFKRGHDILPEYKIGVHTGNVTVGQVGITKKDLVMSGDTINTAARIRSACTELNQKFLVSKEMMDLLDMKDWQTESMGMVDLKGKNDSLELFALKI